jgi:hypothetical protein
MLCYDWLCYVMLCEEYTACLSEAFNIGGGSGLHYIWRNVAAELVSQNLSGH